MIGLVGYVWGCGDDECGCTQATIEALHRNPTDPRFITRTPVWCGTLHIDHEPGAETELDNTRRAMADAWPDAERSIAWGWITQTADYFRDLRATPDDRRAS